MNIGEEKKEKSTEENILNRLKYRKIVSDPVETENIDQKVKTDYYKELLESILLYIKKPKTIVYTVAIISVVVGLIIFSSKQNSISIPESENTGHTVVTTSDVTNSLLYVEVSGQVKNPTVLELKNGARIFQAVNLAGGLTKKADISSINMASLVEDGQKIYIPKKGENSTSSNSTQNGSSGQENGKINLNSASSDELQKIPGVGPATAQKILDYKSQNGSFKSVDDLLNVGGIGEKTLEKLRPYVCV